MDNNEQSMFESVVEPSSTPVVEQEPTGFKPIEIEPEKKKTGLIIGIIVGAILLVGGTVFAVFMIEKAKAEERERRAAAVVVDDDTDFDKKSFSKKKDEKTSQKTDEEDEEESDEEEETDKTEAKKYLEPEGWNIKFTYPEGVIDVKYQIQEENYNGEIFITSIATKDKIYDVNTCGGKSAYQQYPFFLGEISRWNPEAVHEEWDTSPISAGETLALKIGNIEYFVNGNYGNGCETGNENADYVEALRLSKLLIDSMEQK